MKFKKIGSYSEPRATQLICYIDKRTLCVMDAFDEIDDWI